MAAGLLWILDAGNNTAMEPYRAFIADKLDDKQMPLGFKCKVFYWFRKHWHFIPFVFPMILLEKQALCLYASFFLEPSVL
jgi:maltose/moltooligosaccharide transporter